MKKVFTLILTMAIVITGFAQIKSARKDMKKPATAQKVTLTGFEERDYANFPSSTRSVMTSAEETELSQTYYDWQSNMGARNFTAVWPDGYAVMCYTQASDGAYSDRGTGLAIWDPAVGEWEYTETRVEPIKTGFGSISRYKENGLVVASHSANECHLFFCEDFRNGSRDFSEYVTLPNDLGPTWPVVQCSGENLDIVHVLATAYNGTTPYGDPIYYWRYENGEWTASDVMLEPLNADHVTDGGSNITYFMHYNPAKPNRVAFVLNNAWSDGKAVISEDNGATWNERVFYQHPNIHGDFTDTWFFYPRWTGAEFDANDNLCLVYEWNGSTETAGSGSYYPSLGGVGFWSETLPKNSMCVGGIGQVGQPFIMDSCYMHTDLYYSEWYWSDAIHDPLPEYFGELQILDMDENVIPYWGEMPDDYMWIDLDNRGEHGSYNGGIAEFATMHMDGDRIFAFWSMIAGDSQNYLFDGTNHKFRLFGCQSNDGGRTWGVPQHLLTDFMNEEDELVYCQVIPYIYSDSEGEYLWLCYQSDLGAGTYVQSDETDPTDNFYKAAKVYVSTLPTSVEENNMTVANNMSVFPNPANKAFNLELTNEADVHIYNAVGQLVKTYKNVKSLQVNLEAGIYFVQSGDQTKKVVVF